MFLHGAMRDLEPWFASSVFKEPLLELNLHEHGDLKLSVVAGP
jgi:hypothetical protein